MRLLAVLFCVFVSTLSAYSYEAELAEEAAGAEAATNSCVHGFLDVTLKNAYVTPRGLLVARNQFTTQVTTGLSLDLYKNTSTFVNNVSLFGFIWNDIQGRQHDHYVGYWNECDWGVGTNVTFAKHALFGVQFLEFLSPPHHFSTERNIEFLLAYDDSHLIAPVSFQPYAKLFWTVSGDSTVVTGKRGHTYDVELGLVPTWDLRTYGYGVTLTAPTWVTTGPANFWNGGKLGLKNERTKFGVFSTGLRSEIAISCIPKSLGSWYFDVGFQYYRLINDNLLQAQTVTLGVPTRHQAHRNIYVASAGIGFRF
ncbi:MAG: hypothetical protein JSR46_02150 [Verrucomicrobia bacterium]|nr:hypothetical protein [Verrucomicrobiota bacterium]